MSHKLATYILCTQGNCNIHTRWTFVIQLSMCRLSAQTLFQKCWHVPARFLSVFCAVPSTSRVSYYSKFWINDVTIAYETISLLPVTFRSPVRGSNLTIRALSKARAAHSINSLRFHSNEGSSWENTQVITGWLWTDGHKDGGWMDRWNCHKIVDFVINDAETFS